MPITRRFIAQDQNECQIMKMDAANPFIVNDNKDWQFLFGPNSTLSTSDLSIQIAAQFNTTNFNGIKLVAYLYENKTGNISSIGSCTFSVFKVSSASWQDEHINTFTGAALPNSYFYKELSSVDLGGVSLDGETTLMIEATAVRLGTVYRNRIYINHLGIFDTTRRLKNKVNILEITKLDT